MTKCSVYFYPCKHPTKGEGNGIYSEIVSTHLNFKQKQLSSSKMQRELGEARGGGARGVIITELAKKMFGPEKTTKVTKSEHSPSELTASPAAPGEPGEGLSLCFSDNLSGRPRRGVLPPGRQGTCLRSAEAANRSLWRLNRHAHPGPGPGSPWSRRPQGTGPHAAGRSTCPSAHTAHPRPPRSHTIQLKVTGTMPTPSLASPGGVRSTPQEGATALWPVWPARATALQRGWFSHGWKEPADAPRWEPGGAVFGWEPGAIQTKQGLEPGCGRYPQSVTDDRPWLFSHLMRLMVVIQQTPCSDTRH